MESVTDVQGGAMDTCVIRQHKEWTEIFTNFETRNRYAVCNPDGEEMMLAAEVGGGFLSRNFLQAMRPWTIEIVDRQGKGLLTVKRPFKFYFHRAEIHGPDGTLRGAVVRRWSWLRRIYSVTDASGAEQLQLFGPILHPWTFNVLRNGEEVGKITKKWSGLAKEAFTKADNFAVTYRSDLPDEQKQLLLGAVFLIDFVHFERKNNG